MELPTTLGLVLLGLPLVSLAQQAPASARLAPESSMAAQVRNPQDAVIVQRSEAQRHAIENEVKDYLVPMRAWDGKSRPPIGVSLLAKGTGPMDMVWDTSTQTMAAQWRMVQKTDSGLRLHYTTTVTESGAIGFSISSRF